MKNLFKASLLCLGCNLALTAQAELITLDFSFDRVDHFHVDTNYKPGVIQFDDEIYSYHSTSPSNGNISVSFDFELGYQTFGNYDSEFNNKPFSINSFATNVTINSTLIDNVGYFDAKNPSSDNLADGHGAGSLYQDNFKNPVDNSEDKLVSLSLYRSVSSLLGNTVELDYINTAHRYGSVYFHHGFYVQYLDDSLLRDIDDTSMLTKKEVLSWFDSKQIRFNHYYQVVNQFSYYDFVEKDYVASPSGSQKYQLLEGEKFSGSLTLNSINGMDPDTFIAQIPEPSSIALFTMAGLGLARLRKK